MRIATAALVIALAGCIAFPRDGAFGVAGTLPEAAGRCELLLLSDGSTEVPYTRRRIQGQFQEHFTVAPSAKVYHVGVLCEGTMTKVATIRYGTEVSVNRPGFPGEFRV
jgi:hypothetical protein